MKLDCVYLQRLTNLFSENEALSATSRQPPTTTAQSMSVELAMCGMADVLATAGRHPRPDAVAGDLRSWQHFHAITCSTFGNHKLSHIMRCVVANDAWKQPLLMHITLAFSSAHKRHLISDGSGTKTNGPKIEEAHHWQQGLQLYQAGLSHLTNGSSSSKQYTDSLVAATFLIVMYTFTIDNELPERSAVPSHEIDVAKAFAPVAATRGFQALRSHLGDLQGGSIWLPTVSATRSIYESAEQEKLPQAFVELCGLESSTPMQANSYHGIVRHLAVLLRLSGTQDNLSNLFGFSSRLWVFLGPMLQRQDARALLIMAWWVALLCQTNQWWTIARSRKQCSSIVRCLSTSSDPLMQRLLEFPRTFGEADYAWIWDC